MNTTHKENKLTSTRILSNLVATFALVGLVTAPALADKGGRGNGNKNNKGKSGHWNPAPPKKNGRHDNRNWNKDRNDDRNWSGNYRDGSERRYDDRYNDRYYNDRYDGRYYDGYGDDFYLGDLSNRRQQTKNEWRNIALASGGVALLGLLQKDNRLVFAGAAGALYSLYRYEQDRKSQSQIDRLRASYFGRDYFVRDGRRYDRRLVTRNGERYYQFVRR